MHLGFFLFLVFFLPIGLQAQEDPCVRLKSQTLSSPHPPARGFGEVLDISGNTLVVTDLWYEGRKGIGYVYEFNGTEWDHTASLHPPAVGVSWFGKSVATDGERIIVGAGDHAIIFRRIPFGNGWHQEALLNPPDPGPHGRGGGFGEAVTIKGDLALVGEPRWDDFVAPGDSSDSLGRLHIYRLAGSTWNLEQTVRHRDPAVEDSFGSVLDLEGNLILVGVPRKDLISEDEGAVYLFEHDGSSWRQSKRLIPQPFVWSAGYGRSVKIEGDQILVGDNGNGSGPGIDFFQKEGNDWIKTGRLADFGGDFDFENGNLFTKEGFWIGLESPRAHHLHHNGSDWVKVNTFKDVHPLPWFFYLTIAGSENFVALGSQRDYPKVDIFPVADLGLQITPPRPQPGAMVSLTACGGAMHGDAVLVLRDFDGTPLFRKILFGRHNQEGLWEAELGNVPLSLTGRDLSFQVFSLMDPTTVLASHLSTIEVR